jgi:hypothetical protein
MLLANDIQNILEINPQRLGVSCKHQHAKKQVHQYGLVFNKHASNLVQIDWRNV